MLQDIVPFGNNCLFRLLLGWLMPPKISFLKLTQTDAVKRLYENNHIIQDMLVPMTDLKESLSVFDKEVKVITARCFASAQHVQTKILYCLLSFKYKTD